MFGLPSSFSYRCRILCYLDELIEPCDVLQLVAIEGGRHVVSSDGIVLAGSDELYPRSEIRALFVEPSVEHVFAPEGAIVQYDVLRDATVYVVGFRRGPGQDLDLFWSYDRQLAEANASRVARMLGVEVAS